MPTHLLNDCTFTLLFLFYIGGQKHSSLFFTCLTVLDKQTVTNNILWYTNACNEFSWRYKEQT